MHKGSFLKLSCLGMWGGMLLVVSSLILSSSAWCAEQAPPFQVVCGAEDQALCKWPDRELEKRFEQYWMLRYNGPLEKALGCEAPYFQYAASADRYRNFLAPGFKFQIDKIKIFRVSLINETLAEVLMKVYHQKEGSKEIRVVDYKDRWVRVNDQWYHVFQNPLIFPELS